MGNVNKPQPEYGEKLPEAMQGIAKAATEMETKMKAPQETKFSDTAEGQKMALGAMRVIGYLFLGVVVYFLAMGGYALWRAVFGG